jgi:hypothetical protein
MRSREKPGRGSFGRITRFGMSSALDSKRTAFMVTLLSVLPLRA